MEPLVESILKPVVDHVLCASAQEIDLFAAYLEKKLGGDAPEIDTTPLKKGDVGTFFKSLVPELQHELVRHVLTNVVGKLMAKAAPVAAPIAEEAAAASDNGAGVSGTPAAPLEDPQ